MNIEEITGLNPTALVTVRVDWLKKKVTDARKGFALRILERKLAKIITVCNGHRAKNVARYAAPYGVLYPKAVALVEEFCTAYSVPEEDVYAQMPALAELKSWAVRPPNTGSAGRLLVYILGPVVALFIIGLASGWAQRIIHFGWALAHGAR
jgi:hypothetical protein